MIVSREEYVGKRRSLAVMFANGTITEAEYLASDEELRVEWKEFTGNIGYDEDDGVEEEEEDD